MNVGGDPGVAEKDRRLEAARKSRVTLAQIMAFNAAIALALAASRLAPLEVAVLAGVIGLASFLLCVFLVINLQLDVWFGFRCPRCGKRKLRRLALSNLTVAYYQCVACGARRKRSTPFSQWRETGPEDDAKYKRDSTAGRWLGYSTPLLEGLDTMSGRLLKSKRLRTPAHEAEAPERREESEAAVPPA